MIIVEGPDNSGKSTLVNLILETFGDKVDVAPHNIKGPDGTRDKLWETEKPRVYSMLARGIMAKDRPAVCDRLFFSELVYSELLGRECQWNWEEQRHICRVLTAISPPIIFCLPPLEVVADYGDSHQLEGVRERTEQIYKAYEALSSLARPRITRYDHTRGPAAKARVLSVVSRYLERRGKRKW